MMLSELAAILHRAEAPLLARIREHVGPWSGFAPYVIEQSSGGDVICGVWPIETLTAIAHGLGAERQHEIAPVLEELRAHSNGGGNVRYAFVLSSTGAGLARIVWTNARGGSA